MTTMPHATVFALLAALALTPGCASDDPAPVPPGTTHAEAPGELLKSELPRDTTPALSEEAFRSFIAGNAAFVGEVYNQVRRAPELKDANLFFSPVSVSVALGMTYAGARGNTEAEMAAVMRLAAAQSEVHAGFNRLDLALAARNRDAADTDTRPLRFHMLNQLWAQQDYHVESSYLDVLALNYGAGLRLVDFVHDTENTRVRINAWVAEETESRIPELLGKGILTGNTVAVLTNAVYFDAAWRSPFAEEATSEGSFWLEDGTKLSVPTMHATLRARCAERAAAVVLELPYEGEELSMFAILPARGGLAQTELAASDGAALSAMLDGLAEEDVELALPKFSFATSVSLAKALNDAGMHDLFVDGLADLSGMFGVSEASVSDVIHQAFVAVDEAGTEAAAATAVVMGRDSAGLPPENVRRVEFDRPFLFVIRDNPTGAILFMGRVMDPSRQ